MSASRWRPLGLVAAPLVALAPAHVQAQQAQQVLVRGRVLAAETGEPIAGANVVACGTNPVLGTQADERGAFSLRLPSANATLVVSRIGYAPDSVALNGRADVEIRLRRNPLALSEVVVVGYGTQKRSDITGSVTSVSTERLEGKPNVGLQGALQGALPGVSVTTAGAGAEGNVSSAIS